MKDQKKSYKLRDTVGGKYTVKAYTRGHAVDKIRKLTGMYVYVVD